jgi:hydroxymethylpyrimidine pyrophosphatase-like HAD family hydrolase
MPTDRRLPVTREAYDALVFDLDGTLLDGAGRVTPAARAELARARDLGFVVVLATGRSLAGTREVHAQLALDTEIVAYNGAWIGRPGDAVPWHYAAIPDELVAHLPAVEAHGEAKFTPRTDHPEHPRVMGWYTNVVPVASPAALPGRDLLRVSLFYGDVASTDDAWVALADEARAELHREVFPMNIFPEFADTGLVLCEVQRKGRGKAETLRLLAERYGIPPARVVAVGDQHNDLSILAGAGLAVAMGNAIPAAKALARVVIGEHREDGVARWLAATMG